MLGFLLLLLLLIANATAARGDPGPAPTAADTVSATPAARDTLAAPAAAESTATAPAPPATIPSAPARADTTSPRIVREFPPVEVRVLVNDLNSSQVTHLVSGTTLHRYPVDNLADVFALQPGVVAQGEELHVRGGRSGETAVSLDGLALNEPLKRRAFEVPLLALRSAELVSGAPEAQFGGGLAGVLNLTTVDPGERLSGEWRWQSDARAGTHYDRVAGRVGTPLHAFGLGAVAAAEAMLDDTWQPALRSESRREILGLSWGWRAENRMLGFLKLAPVDRPERYSAEVMYGRQVHQPYDPAWTLDGWVSVPYNLKMSPLFSPTPQPGYLRYRAADRLAITDDRQLATLVKFSTLRASTHATLSLGWLRNRAVTSVGGQREPESASHRPRFGNSGDEGNDGFYVLWGDYPIYRESASDVFTLRGDAERVMRTGGVKAGLGLTYDQVRMREMDWMPFAGRVGDLIVAPPLDSIRAYEAYAPGGYGYLQGRWLAGGMILNTGLRVECFSAGPQANRQTLPGNAHGVWSFGPRLGIAYPISVRDAFSLAYVRIQQSPGRDYLYDRRVAISDRQPLGNPAIEPATLISYEASVKHLFGPAWALQASVFYRDVFGQIGALDFEVPEGPINLRYVDSDESHAHGFEWAVIHAEGDERFEASYTWMNASGNESRPGGDPYGPLRSARTPMIVD
jgi:outer membrane receptor protein involved in Fe transport